MTIYYVDPEGGNDNNTGTSFAQRWKTLRAGYWSNLDEIRFIASPDPTLIGSGKVQELNEVSWIDGATWIKTLTESTTTGATNIEFTGYTDANGDYPGHRLNTGDTVYIYDSVYSINGTWEVTKVDDTNFTLNGYNAGQNITSTTQNNNGKFVNLSGRRVQLSSAVTQNIASFGQSYSGNTRSAWTTVSNTSAYLDKRTNGGWYDSDSKASEGLYSDRFVISGGATSGTLLAYYPTGTLNLSGYEQVSLKYKTKGSNAGHASGLFSLRLCTDTAGQTSVHSIDLSARGAQYKGWVNITKDFGSALNSSIQSVAIYADSAINYSYEFVVSNIIACKASSSADSLTHSSLIGLNTADDPDWFGIESINGTRILLNSCRGGNDMPILSYYSQGLSASWSASNSNADIYKRETIKRDISVLTSQSESYSNPYLVFNKGYYSSYPIQFTKFTGGWDRTSMSTQNTGAMTYFDGVISAGYGLDVQWNTYYAQIEKLAFVRFSRGMNVHSGAYYISIDQVAFTDCYTGLHTESNQDFYKLVVNHCVNCGGGEAVRLYNFNPRTLGNYSSYYGGFTGGVTPVYADRDNYKIRSTCAKSNALALNQFSAYMPMKYLTVSHNRDAAVYMTSGSGSLEIETLDVSRLGQHTGVNISDTTKLTSYTVEATQTAPVVAMYGAGRVVIGTISNVISLPPIGSGSAQPGEDASAYQNSFNINGGYLRITGGTVGSRLSAAGSGVAEVKDTTVNTTINASPFAVSGSAICRFKNSAGYSVYNAYPSSSYIKPSTSYRHTNSGISWEFKLYGSIDPMEIFVGKVAVNSGTQASISVWGYSTQSTYNNQAVLRVDGSNVGLGSSLTTDLSSATTSGWTWGEMIVNFTPTSAGFVDVYLSWGDGTSSYSSVYFDDMSATQA